MIRALCAVLMVAAVVAPAAWAAGDIPFIDGPTTAAQYQRGMNKSAEYSGMSCRYRRPLVRCAGYVRLAKTDTYLRGTVVVHKTAPKIGYMMVCVTKLGVCRRFKVTFSH